jgi:hypothetical protein
MMMNNVNCQILADNLCHAGEVPWIPNLEAISVVKDFLSRT